MSSDTIGELEVLLAQAEAAHAEFEATELNGVYDEAWPRWYAQYAIDHGIERLLGRDLSVEGLASLLATSWDEAQQADPKPTDKWSAYTARRIAAEL